MYTTYLVRPLNSGLREPKTWLSVQIDIVQYCLLTTCVCIFIAAFDSIKWTIYNCWLGSIGYITQLLSGFCWYACLSSWYPIVLTSLHQIAYVYIGMCQLCFKICTLCNAALLRKPTHYAQKLHVHVCSERISYIEVSAAQPLPIDAWSWQL